MFNIFLCIVVGVILLVLCFGYIFYRAAKATNKIFAEKTDRVPDIRQFLRSPVRHTAIEGKTLYDYILNQILNQLCIKTVTETHVDFECVQVVVPSIEELEKVLDTFKAKGYSYSWNSMSKAVVDIYFTYKR